jgi:translation initiation factor IF-2
MSDVTIKELALKMGMPGDKLLTQLKAAGMKFSDQEQVISSTEKVKLLGFLRRNKNQDADAAAGEGTPRHVTLRRRTVGELKVATPGPRGAPTTAKTVNVEVRGKRTYVKRSVIAEAANAEPEREDAVRKLEESRLRQEQEVADSARAAERRQQEAEQRSADEAQAAAAQLPAADTGSTPKSGEVLVAPEVPAAQEPAAEPDGGDAQGTVQRIDPRDLGMIIPQIQAPHKRQRVVKPVAKPAAETTTRAAPSPPPPPPTDAGSGHAKAGRHVRERAEGTGGRDGRGAKRFGGGQMHLSEADRARRSSGSKRSRVVRPGRDLSRSGASATAAHAFSRPTAPVVREVTVSDTNTVSDLAQKMAVKGAEVVKALFKMGVMATINQSIDHDTAVLVVEELGHKPVTDTHNDAEQTLAEHTQTAELEGEKSPRPPVVTIMGHVDHGKTSLLDYIRRTKVASGEAGGITQHIGAYHVQTSKGGITFIDTPGHAAFSAMRARGAQSTDIVVLVVAADDGVMPQTIEAINHAQSAHVPIIIAINKIDRPEAKPDRIKQQLTEHNLVVEEYGGDVIAVPVSAKTGEGIPDLLEYILLVADIQELKADPSGHATGVIIEAQIEPGRGPVATVLVQTGTLRIGDSVVAGLTYGRVRAMMNERGERLQKATPATPVEVIGLHSAPEAGDTVEVVKNDRESRQTAERRQQKQRAARLSGGTRVTLDELYRRAQAGEIKDLNLIVKGDVQGSVEAVLGQIRELEENKAEEEVRLSVKHSGVGNINESDITLAEATNAIVIGFNVRADASAQRAAESGGVDVRLYNIIYDLVEDIDRAMKGMLTPIYEESPLGKAEVRQVFRTPRGVFIAGCYVTEGKLVRGAEMRVKRGRDTLFTGRIDTLRHVKEDAREIAQGFECGLTIQDWNDYQIGDILECFEMKQVLRT